MHLSEKTVDKEVVFEGRIITVRKDKAELEDGSVVGRELVIHSGGVCVVPLTNDNKVIMVRQFRYAFGEPLLEIPAGKLERARSTAAPLSGSLRKKRALTAADLSIWAYATPLLHILPKRSICILQETLNSVAHIPTQGSFLTFLKFLLTRLCRWLWTARYPMPRHR